MELATPARSKSYEGYNVYRSLESNHSILPLSLRSVGHCKASIDWQDWAEIKTFFQLFWNVSGEALFEVDGKTEKISGNQVFIYWPGHRHLIRAVSKIWEYRYMTYDGPCASDLTKSFGFQHKITESIACPTHLFEKMELSVSKVGIPNMKAAACDAYQMLSLASSHFDSTIKMPMVMEHAINLVNKNYHSTELNVNFMARHLKLHRSSLHTYFEKYFGMGPSEYISHYRIQKALSLLKSSSVSMKTIADQCGFANAQSLSKVVKKHTHQSPREYRKEI